VNPHYSRVAGRAGHRCEYCHAPEAAFNFPFEIDHIRPTALGGRDEDGNLALVCRSCNAYKSDAAFAEEIEGAQPTRLFHPRTDRWDEHFAVIADDNVVHGLTPIGRATVGALRMNAPKQVAARSVWRSIGLYP
jgi:hypothetical protein